MDCYFGSYRCPDSKGKKERMLVCFAIPSMGIAFKAPFSGEELHTEYASLLTLLEFIELNHNIFKDKELRIFGDCRELINQISNSTCRYEFSELLRKALDYRARFGYSLSWIPKNSNPSTTYLFD
jgi:hypothetical protein